MIFFERLWNLATQLEKLLKKESAHKSNRKA